MSGDFRPDSALPFPADYRASGVLLHVTSLPSAYGIGDVGPAARAWIDRLRAAGQRWWQVLPLNPTASGNSPYEPLSSFAGNELLISPEDLIEDGLLRASECEGPVRSTTDLDYDAVTLFKDRLLETAWTNFRAGTRPDLREAYDQFRGRHASWLEDYAVFRALKASHNGASHLEWPEALLQRRESAMAHARRNLRDQIDRVRFAQFLAFRQGERLKAYAHVNGVRVIGDLPFYVALDSSDIWAHSELFLLDGQHRPRAVAGVPPDYFSAQGQLWGNPLYDWDALRRTGYRWYIDRLRALLAHVHVIRLDHFRGFAAAWHVPAGAPTARQGEWVPGPGAELFEVIRRELGGLPFIAEDLGLITPDVAALRERLGIPGCRVLQFAFDGQADNPHLPRHYIHNTAVYTGTHDNPPTRAWFDALPEDQRRRVEGYLQRPPGEKAGIVRRLMDLVWSSAAALAIAPLQDVLNLGGEARMNTPGRADGNWRWRCTEEMLRGAAFEWLGELTHATTRAVGQEDADRGRPSLRLVARQDHTSRTEL